MINPFAFKIRLLYIAWTFVLGFIFWFNITYKDDTTLFFGIADTSEITLKSEHGVTIEEIHVVEGQKVKKGDPIMDLNRIDLAYQISETKNQINQLKAEKGLDFMQILAKMKRISAQKKSRYAELNAEIKRLEAQLQQNRTFARQLDSFDQFSSPSAPKNSPIANRITTLKEDLRLQMKEFDVQLEALNDLQYSADKPLSIKSKRLTDSLERLLEEQKALKIRSPIDGIIGTIYHKKGENIRPFDPYISVHEKNPSFVKGYIHENVYNKIKIGFTVKVKSITDHSVAVIGTVVGIGTRIVEYPQRLRQRQGQSIWGREITIHIPKNNSFLLGEKLSIISTGAGP